MKPQTMDTDMNYKSEIIIEGQVVSNNGSLTRSRKTKKVVYNRQYKACKGTNKGNQDGFI